MAISKKQRHQLKLAAKRRDRRPEPSVVPATQMKVSNGERNRVTQSSSPLLFGLESLLVVQADEGSQVDDFVVSTALRSVVQNNPSETESVQKVMDSISRWRESQDDDERTEAVMRIVYQSIQTRSNCQPGDLAYLTFARGFVHNARRSVR